MKGTLVGQNKGNYEKEYNLFVPRKSFYVDKKTGEQKLSLTFAEMEKVDNEDGTSQWVVKGKEYKDLVGRLIGLKIQIKNKITGLNKLVDDITVVNENVKSPKLILMFHNPEGCPDGLHLELEDWSTRYLLTSIASYQDGSLPTELKISGYFKPKIDKNGKKVLTPKNEQAYSRTIIVGDATVKQGKDESYADYIKRASLQSGKEMFDFPEPAVKRDNTLDYSVIDDFVFDEVLPATLMAISKSVEVFPLDESTPSREGGNRKSEPLPEIDINDIDITLNAGIPF